MKIICKTGRINQISSRDSYDKDGLNEKKNEPNGIEKLTITRVRTRSTVEFPRVAEPCVVSTGWLGNQTTANISSSINNNGPMRARSCIRPHKNGIAIIRIAVTIRMKGIENLGCLTLCRQETCCFVYRCRQR